MSKTLKFIIISSVLLFGLLPKVEAQETTPVVKPEKADSVKTKIWQGFFVEVDVAPFIETALINKYAYTYQGNLMLNLSNRFFPVVELGIAGADKTVLDGASFSTNGMFQKVGIDFRLMKPNPAATIKHNFVLGGLRLGMSNFNYSITNAVIEDPYWGGVEVINENSLNATKFWLEFTAGMRVSLYKNVYLGWNVRNKRLLNQSKEGENSPWYVPGYGIGKSAVWGFSYTLGYKF